MLMTFVDFATANLPRFQLMNQRVVADFTPTEASYAPSVRVMDLFRERMRTIGIPRAEDVDLCAALVGGLVDAQFANDPGGNRYLKQLPRVLDMFADDIGLPGPTLRRIR
jgi:hypothetical protein